MQDKESFGKENELFNQDDKGFYEYDINNNNEVEEPEFVKEYNDIDKDINDTKGNKSNDGLDNQNEKEIIDFENCDNDSKSKNKKFINLY